VDRFGYPETPFLGLELFEKLASRAGDVHSAGHAALAVLDALNNACGLGALGAIRALLCIHDLIAVAGFGNLRHRDDLPETNVRLARPEQRMRASTLLDSVGWAGGLGRTGGGEGARPDKALS
jgi:hypothetical protein